MEGRCDRERAGWAERSPDFRSNCGAYSGMQHGVPERRSRSRRGFDPRFRTAGDDVDICWRLQDRGEVIGYSAAAVVWHHRRRHLRTYWKQQVGYGKAEALLEKKWPSRYDFLGRSSWLGRMYGRGLAHDLTSLGGRVYQGVWGTAPFQSLYQSSHSRWSLAAMPEWYVLVAIVGAMFLLSLG